MGALEVLPDVKGFLQLITKRVLFIPHLFFRLVLSLSIYSMVQKNVNTDFILKAT